MRIYYLIYKICNIIVIILIILYFLQKSTSFTFKLLFFFLFFIFFSFLFFSSFGGRKILARMKGYFCPRILQVPRLGYGVTLISANFIFARAPNVTETCRYRRNKTEIRSTQTALPHVAKASRGQSVVFSFYLIPSHVIKRNSMLFKWSQE